MGKKKKLLILAAATVLVIAVVLVLCFVCFHSWQGATCESPTTCKKCGETRGEPLGHEWVEATCVEVKTCTRCGKTAGDPLGHSVTNWDVMKEASCSAEGERTGYCERCKKDCTEAIEKLPHTESEWAVVKDYVIKSDATVVPGTEAITCTVCNEQIKTRDYTVKLTNSQKNAALSAYDELNFWHCGPDFLAYNILSDCDEFPVEDAKLVVAHMGTDWDEQAILYVKQNSKGVSKSGLTSNMQRYGFSSEQIDMALKEVGY